MTRILPAEGLYERAVAAWRDTEWLRFAFPDAQTFAEHARALNVLPEAWLVAEGLCRWSAYGKDSEEGLARAAAFRLPMSSSKAYSISRRYGTRLVLWLYGPIGVATERGAIDADAVQKALNDNGDVQAIYLRIDSSGGDIAAAGRIATALIAHRAKKIAIVDRTCWSCAYRIAAAATRIFARKDATFMLHPTSCLSHGNHVDLRNQANVLQDIDYRYLDFIRSMRRKVSRDQLLELQRSERFFSATEALELGLVDRLTESLAPAPAGISTSPVRSTDEQE